jgi:hypothetical protein
MGEPVLIRDLAEQMIRFYGFEPDRDIKIEYTGTRPGERLDERLWADDEEPLPTEFNRILKVQNRCAGIQPEHDEEAPVENRSTIVKLIEKLYPIVYFDPARKEMYRDSALLNRLLQEAIPSFGRRRGIAAPAVQKPKVPSPVM